VHQFPICEFIWHVDYFRVARNPSGIDVKRGDHFLQADFPVLISSMSGLAIYHSSRRS